MFKCEDESATLSKSVLVATILSNLTTQL